MNPDQLLKEIQQQRGHFETLAKDNPAFQKAVAMWEPMKAGGYLQIDETPVKVLDPEVKGKAAQGYLWFYGVPGGDVVLEFSMTRGQDPPKKRLQGFEGVFQSDDFSSYGCVERDIAGATPSNPQEYLTDVLRRLPGLTNQQLDPLLPANWKAHPP